MTENDTVHIENRRGNWQVYTTRSNVNVLIYSEDLSTLWVGTGGGLEKRDALTGQLEAVYTERNGLPSNDVISLLDDGEGGLWVGTTEDPLSTGGGLAHLNANGSWEVFDKNNSSLQSNTISALLSDGFGGIWVGEYALVHLKSNGEWVKFNSFNSDLPATPVWALLSDDQGGIWVGTSGGVAHMKADGSWDVLDTSNSGLPDNSVMYLASDGQGGVWAGTFSHGFARMKSDSTWECFDISDSGLPGDVNSFLSDGQGGLWIGTYANGLAHLNVDGTWDLFNTSNSGLPADTVTSLLFDPTGGIWIGTDGRGLSRLNTDGTWDPFDQSKFNLPDNDIKALLSDGQGGLWVGTVNYMNQVGGGLAHLKPDDSWEVFDETNSDLPHSFIRALIPDDQGGLWVATAWNGIVHWQRGNTWTIFNSANSGLPIDYIRFLLSDNAGGIWVGTDGGGLAHLSGEGEWEIFHTANSDLPHDRVWSVAPDTRGGLWIGTYGGGLAHLKADKTWELFDRNNSQLPENEVYAILPDGQGGIWAGLQWKGLAHLKIDGTWDLLNTANSDLPDDMVTSLYPDGQGGVWAGTNRGGIGHRKFDGTWDVFDRSNSDLPSNAITAFHADGAGGMWVGTSLDGLAHLIFLGAPQQISDKDSPDIAMTWFLNSALLDFQSVRYIELQRALSKTAHFETVLDESGTPIRFYADYADCPRPRVDNCRPSVEGHTPTYWGEGESRVKGYTLDLPAIDSEWLEGVPRYYRLSAVIETEDGLVRVANSNEAVLMAPSVEENPRIGLTLERSAIAVAPGSSAEITLFVSSLDLFNGNVTLSTEFEETSSKKLDITLNDASTVLIPGKTVSTALRVQTPPEGLLNDEEIVTVISRSPSSDHEKRATLRIISAPKSMIGLSIAAPPRRPRVMDHITVTGNIIPAESRQEVIIFSEEIRDGSRIEKARLITSEGGFFEGAFPAVSAGPLRLSAQIGGMTSRVEEIFILPAKTHIALTSDVNQNTKKNDLLKIKGIIGPIRSVETHIHLNIRYMDPADPKGESTPQFVGDVTVADSGLFSKDIKVPGDGFIHVMATLPETPDFLGVETTLVIPVGQSVGEAIIMVSESGTPEFQEISKSLGAYVFNTLQTRNIPNERMRYLGLSDDGIQSDGYADKNNIRHALTTWAVSLISTDDPYKTPLNLYLIGEIEDGHFRLNENETLSAAELDQYLDEAETLITSNFDSEIKGLPVTIVLEGSRSEKWIKTITGKGRIVLTSSSAAPIDQGGFAGYDNLGESSFSRYFYQFINYGSDIEASFAEANYEILKFYRHTQRPVMDADGDGVGTTKYDRYEASGKFIEYRPSGNLRPKIRTTHPDMTITGRENNTLWAIATDPEQEMKGVFCSITDPSNRSSHLELNPMDDRGNWYEVTLENFSQTGCHQVVYYAKDSAGNVSLPVERFLHVTASALHSNPDPEDPVDEPDDPVAVPQAPTLTLTMEGSRVSISWTAVPDADGYTLLYAPYPDGVTIGQFDMGSQTRIPTFEAGGMAFYVAVQAYNHQGTSGLSNIESFGLIY